MGIQFSAYKDQERLPLMGFEWMGWSYGNAEIMFALMDNPKGPPLFYVEGYMRLPRARQAIIWGRNTLESRGPLLERPTVSEGNQTIVGITLSGMENRLKEFSDFVEAAAKAGADGIRWS